MQIKDKRAIIVGASNGLGMAFSKELLRNGVAVKDFNPYFREVLGKLLF
jgi:NAD(P)-dependent dehydrogenase (short-subunit alcohol dehydrogenase family)